MAKTQQIRCPNCGSYAERSYGGFQQVTQTTCPVCDYFMRNCSRTGQVFEFYAPGIAARYSQTV